MTFTAETYNEAFELARELRAQHWDTDCEVEIVPPLFPGDLYRVNVN